MNQRVELIIQCVNDTRKALQEITSSFQGVIAKIAAWNYSIRSGFTLVQKALDVVVLITVRAGDERYKMSQKTGISVEELYRLKSVAELSDVDLNEMGVTLGVLSRNLLEAKTKAGDARAIFEALGIDTAQPLGKIFNDLAKRFSEMRDGEDKMALAMRLFGKCCGLRAGICVVQCNNKYSCDSRRAVAARFFLSRIEHMPTLPFCSCGRRWSKMVCSIFFLSVFTCSGVWFSKWQRFSV